MEILFCLGVLLFLAQTNTNALPDIIFANEDSVLAAFGDFNSDELTDAFIITNNTNIQIYLAHTTEPLLRPSVFACNFTGFSIKSVVPGDFDGDAYMDILITTKQLQDVEDLHQVRILWGGSSTLNCSDASIVKLVAKGQPLVLDYNRDMTLDLFGLDTKNRRMFWVFDRLRSIPQSILLEEEGTTHFKEIKLPHSNSFLDRNNDNAADLLITTKVDVEVWLSSENGGFEYDKSLSIDLLVGNSAIYGQALFTDLALSGEFDLVIPVCSDIQCLNSTIMIYDNEVWHDLRIDFNDGKGTQWRFVPPRDEIYLDTITMRSGDYNMDGYPDVLVTLSPTNSNETKVFLLHNSPCEAATCTFHRTFKVQWDLLQTFGSNVVMATFYDLYMDGVLDIIYVEKNTTTNKYIMNAYKNVLEFDTNFIKVIVLTGLTNPIKPKINGTLYPRTASFGTNLPGPRISYETWSQEGTYRTGVCAQLPQSAYFALQLPYSIFGLDRTPNFVETLNVGLSGYSKSWTQIIPNSQIVVIPAPISDPFQWSAQLFVTPSKVILKSVLVVTAILVVNIGLVLFLHWKERHERLDVMEIDEKVYVRI